MHLASAHTKIPTSRKALRTKTERQKCLRSCFFLFKTGEPAQRLWLRPICDGQGAKSRLPKWWLRAASPFLSKQSNSAITQIVEDLRAPFGQYALMDLIVRRKSGPLKTVPVDRIAQKAGLAILLWFTCAGATMLRAQDSTTGRRPHARNLPLTKFYETPNPLPAGNPGELIRSTAFDDYDLPITVSAVRILYHSRSASGEDIASSGVVLFPDKKAPAGGWPVIAWAHDLNGVARSCAPSLARNLRHGSFLSMYVQLGYAIVATDYAGLGTKSRSAYADIVSNAYDVTYAIPAARKAVPELGSRWIAMGTDEGAMAVVAVAELEHDMGDPNFLGGVAISRIQELRNQYQSLQSLSYRMPLFLAYGVQTVYPEFKASDILTAKALSLYARIADTCSESDIGPEPSGSEMLNAKWEGNSFVQKYFERNRAGLRPAEGRLFVLGSEADSSIAETVKVVSQMCSQGDKVQFERYPGYDPGRLMGDSIRDQIAWIEAVFAGKAVRNDCKSLH